MDRYEPDWGNMQRQYGDEPRDKPSKVPSPERLVKMSDKVIWKNAVLQRIVDMYGTEFGEAFIEVMISGYEPFWMSDYFDSWNEVREDIKEYETQEEKFLYAYEAAHDTAMFIADGLRQELGIETLPKKELIDELSQFALNVNIDSDGISVDGVYEADIPEVRNKLKQDGFYLHLKSIRKDGTFNLFFIKPK